MAASPVADSTMLKIIEMFKKAIFEEDSSIKMNCPVCNTDEICFEKADYKHSTGYTAWKGQGDCMKIPLWCRNGHVWEFCFGFHKGYTYTFIDNVKKLAEENRIHGND